MDLDSYPVDQSASAPADLQSDVVSINGASGGEVCLMAAAVPRPEVENLDSYHPFEPPPLDWRSDSSSEAGTADDLVEPDLSPSADCLDTASVGESVLPPVGVRSISTSLDTNLQVPDAEEKLEGDETVEKEMEVNAEGVQEDWEETFENVKERVIQEEVEVSNRRSDDEDHNHIHTLLSQLHLRDKEPHPCHQESSQSSLPEQVACASSLFTDNSTETTGLLFSEIHHSDLLGLLQYTEISATPQPTCLPVRGEVDAVVSVSYCQGDAQKYWGHYGNGEEQQPRDNPSPSLPDDYYAEPVWLKRRDEPPEDETAAENKQVGAKAKLKFVMTYCYYLTSFFFFMVSSLNNLMSKTITILI